MMSHATAGPAGPFPTLHTPRLHLREITPADAPALLALHGNAEAMRWFGSDPINDLAGAHRLIEMFAGYRTLPHPGTRWGLCLREDDRLIGTCGLFGWNAGWRQCTIGYELLPRHQGAGLMHEALQAAIGWGHEHRQLHRIEAIVHPDNQPSITLLRRLGFEQEGRLRDGARWGGRFHDMLLFAHIHTPAGAA